MKQPQVITISPTGGISGLQRKDGVSLRIFGDAEIKRSTDIKYCKKTQKWYVEFLDKPVRKISKKLTKLLFDMVKHPEVEFKKFLILSQARREEDGLAYFEEYDQAVDAEIQTMNYLRLQGIY